MASKSPLKTKPLRTPGQSVDAEIQRLLDDTLLQYYFFAAGFVLIAGIEWYAYLMKVPRMPWLYTAMALIAVAAFVCRMIPLRAQVRALRQGRDGERVVAEHLDVLKGLGALIYHDVRGDGFNLDHVVVCSKGIFAVETKTFSKPHPKAVVEFDGKKILVAGRELEKNPIVRAVSVFDGPMVTIFDGLRCMRFWRACCTAT